MHPQIGTVLGGRYRLERKLGQGGMGSVFAATDLQLQRAVAVKLLDDASQGSRFELEARTIAGLGHPNIATLFDFQPGPTPFLVMELVEGETLRALLVRERQLPVPRAIHFATQILAALGVAHGAGTIHRDIKPSNVMILPGDRVKLVDFGVAKVADGTARQHRTADGSVIGTLQYMPPEQAAGQAVTPAADLYALGVCLFEMLAGYNPFAVGELPAVYLAVRDLVPPDLRQRRPDVPAPLAQAVARALAKPIQARFTSAAELAQALLGAPTLTTAGPPSFVARPPSFVTHAGGPPSFVQSAPAPAGSTGLKVLVVALLLALVAVVAIAGTLWAVRPDAAVAVPAAPAASSGPVVASAAAAPTAAPSAAPAARGGGRGGAAPVTPAPSASTKKPSGQRCVCRVAMVQSPPPPDPSTLCRLRLAQPECYCQPPDNENEHLCGRPWTVSGNSSPVCTDHSETARTVTGGKNGMACPGYRYEHGISTKITGELSCQFCENGVYPGDNGAPCEGYNRATGGLFKGTLDGCEY